MDRLQSMGIVSKIDPRDLPAPSSSTSTIGPIIGVVDGSDAAPGEVGEFITGIGFFTYAGYPNVSNGFLTLLNVPPGDWDFTVSSSYTGLIDGSQFALSPKPQGMSNDMIGENANFAMGSVSNFVIIGQSARGSFAVTTTMTFEVNVDNSETVGLVGGQMGIRLEGRRRR